MAQIWIDGKQWLTADYLTVAKDLLVKGDFTLEGGGSQSYDEIVQGSLQVQGTAAIRKLAAGTYSIPAGVQHYIKGTAYLTKAYGTHYGKFYGTWTGSLGSVTSLTVDKLTAGSFTAGTVRVRTIKGTHYGRGYGTYYGQFLGTLKGELGSVTSLTVDKLTAGSISAGTIYTRNIYGTHRGRGYGTYYGQFQGTLTGYIGSVTTLTTDKLTAGSATIGTLQARFAGLGTKPGGYRLSMKSGSVSYVDALGSTVLAIFKGSAQARIGMGRNVYLGSMVDALHVWSTGCEFRVRQAYGQVTRLWVDQAVLNISKGNFGSPFAAALSVTPGSSKKVGIEVYGTVSQTANLVRLYRNSAGSLVLAVGTQYALRSYGTVRMTRLGIGTRSNGYLFVSKGTASFNRFIGTYLRLVQGGSAKPGSAGYITFGRAFAAAPSAVLTQKDAWVPSVAYGPRIKRIAAGSMQAMGSPAGYAWWQAAGSAF